MYLKLWIKFVENKVFESENWRLVNSVTQRLYKNNFTRQQITPILPHFTVLEGVGGGPDQM